MSKQILEIVLKVISPQVEGNSYYATQLRWTGHVTYSDTAGMGTVVSYNTAGTCPYNHLKTNFALFGWTYSQSQMNTALRRLRLRSYIPSRSLS